MKFTIKVVPIVLAFSFAISANSVLAKQGDYPFEKNAHAYMFNNLHGMTARSVVDRRDPYTDGARKVTDPRDPYTDGARTASEVLNTSRYSVR